MSLQPTDRVLAKLVMRAWIDSEYNNNTTAEDFALKFTNGVFPAIKSNLTLTGPLLQLLAEVIEEVLAEEAGTASPNTQPYPNQQPQPWMDDAGSGC